ncbi:hypothetical protein [Actinotalea sp.]|uniref:hypothetical protein n=1 Tax=Actinotalea sp. TaxID=1872145 RepID=UPI003566F940
MSHADDLHTREVLRHLDHLGADTVLIDTAGLPRDVALTTTQDADRWHADWVVVGDDGPAARSVDADELRVMWWRRPQPFGLHEEIGSAQDRAFAHGECAAAVAGLWSCLDATWVNDPDRDEAASRKMWQLKIATRLGLRVPRTCMTNDPERARAFIAAEPTGVIYKSFSATARTWRETRPVGEVDLGLIDAVRYAPVIFQELIPGGVDIRVTVIGREMFAAEFRAGESAYEFDFRIDTAHCPTAAHELPSALRERLLALMDRLGLLYGAIDLRLTPEGDYVFLEINPAGQWLFVEYATGQPITAELAGLLARLDTADAASGVHDGPALASHRERSLLQ